MSFQYDPFGRKIQKSSAGGTTVYVYDGANGVEQVNASGAVVARYVQGAGIDEPLAQSSTSLNFYNADGLGSITSMDDASGTPTATFVYGAFGVLNSSSGTVANSYRYTAREYDAETGLYYYRARYYDNSIGRFMTEDPATEGRGRLSWAGDSSYVYVRDNPTSWFDPTGLVKWSCRIRMATVRSWPAVTAISATCNSECFGGKRLHQTVVGAGGGGSIGYIPVSATYFEAELEDSYAFPYDFSLPGLWAYAGAGAAGGVLGGSYSGLRLGAATGQISWGWQAGVDLGVSAVGGVSVATTTEWQSCCSGKEK